MKLILSILIWIMCLLVTIAAFLAILCCVILFFPFDKQRRIAHAQGYWWSDILFALNPFWKLKVQGLENIDHKKTYVIVANHQSMADIILIYKTRMQFKWVAKSSLFNVPFLGWSMSLAQYMKLTRGKFSSVKEAYLEASDFLQNNMSVLFFPEGTRNSEGKIKEFQNGAFKLAIQERKPILPIAISGTGAALPKGNWIFKNRVFCKLTIFPEIDTTNFEPRDFAQLKNLVITKLATT